MHRGVIGCAFALTTVIWAFSTNGRMRADELGEVLPSPPPTVPVASDGEVPEGAIELQLLLVELRGDAERALKSAGLRESPEKERFLSEPDPAPRSVRELADRKRAQAALESLLETLRQHAELDVLSRPKVRTISGQSATLQVSSEAPRIPYFIRTGPKTFELREAVAESGLGFVITLTARLNPEDPEQIEISPLKIAITTLDGRAPVRGVDLDIGKPIFSTRTLETSITLVEGPAVSGIVLPGPPGRQPVLFVSARRPRSDRMDRSRPANK